MRSAVGLGSPREWQGVPACVPACCFGLDRRGAPPADRLATDIDSEVEAALVLFDEIERLAEMPMANEAINAMLERIDLRIGL